MSHKSWLVKDRVCDETFRKVCLEANSMSQAAASLGLHFNSFKKRALELGCYLPNQAGIGIRKHSPKIPIEDIIERNLHPQYQTYKLKIRLLEEGIFQNRCDTCGIDNWNSKSLNMELHHIDGNRTNHHISNLEMICPNCHSQTENFRVKNK